MTQYTTIDDGRYEPRPLRGGKIQRGEMVVSGRTGNTHPMKLDHFKITPADETLQPLLDEIYGPKPTAIRILLAGRTVQEVFPHSYACFASSRLLCQGNGVEAERFGNDAGPESVACLGPYECPFSMERADKDGKPGCGPNGTLNFMLHDIKGFTIWQSNIHGGASIRNVKAKLNLLANFGSLWGREVVMKLVPHVSIDRKGKKHNNFAVDIEVDISPRELMSGRAMPALPSAMVGTPQLSAPEQQDKPEELATEPANVVAPRLDVEPEPAPAPPAPAAPEPEEPTQQEFVPDKQSPPTPPTPPPARKATGGGLDSDPEVQAALDGLSELKKKALLTSAKTNGWIKQQLLQAIEQRKGARF